MLEEVGDVGGSKGAWVVARIGWWRGHSGWRWRELGRGWVVALALFSLIAVVAGCAGSASLAPVPTATAAVLPLPTALASYHIFVADLLSGDVAELGRETLKVSESVHGLGLSSDGKTLFVTDIAGNHLVGYALNNGQLGARHSVLVGSSPVHMVETLDGQTIYVSDFGTNTISVVNAASWTLRATITLPTAVTAEPHGIVLSPDGRWVYAACYGGSAIAVIDAAQAKLVDLIPLPDHANPYGIAISADGSAVYASDNFTGRLFVINTATRQIEDTLEVGLHPALIARAPDGKTLYVANGGSHSVSVVSIAPDPLHPRIRATVNVDGYPHGIAISPDGRYVVVANTYGQNLSVIETATLKVIDTIPAGKYPNDVLITG